MSSQFNIVNVNERDDSSDDAYWSNYHHIISTDKDQVWDGLIYTLNKYLYVAYTRLSQRLPALYHVWHKRTTLLRAVDREFEFYEFFSFLKFNEFYEFFGWKKFAKNS